MRGVFRIRARVSTLRRVPTLSLRYAVLARIAALTSPEPDTQSPEAAREALRLAVRGPRVVFGAPAAVAATQDAAVAGVPTRRYTPHDLRAGRLLFMHGGGWVVGDLDTHDALARALAVATGLETLAIDYRRAPEHVFPAALDDCLAVTRAALAEAQGAPVFVAGDSAGGNLAAVVALHLGAQLAGQVLLYPVTDAAHEAASYATFSQGFMLTAASMRRYRALYAPTPEAQAHPDCSPLRAPRVDQAPPAYVVLAQCDVLRDEGAAYAARLQAAGVPCVVDEARGALHGFMSMQGLREARETTRRVGDWARRRCSEAQDSRLR